MTKHKVLPRYWTSEKNTSQMFPAARKRAAAAKAAEEQLAIAKQQEQEAKDEKTSQHLHELQLSLANMLQTNADVENERNALEEELQAVRSSMGARLRSLEKENTTLTSKVSDAETKQAEIKQSHRSNIEKHQQQQQTWITQQEDFETSIKAMQEKATASNTTIQDQTVRATELKQELQNTLLERQQQEQQWITQQTDFETTIKAMQEESTNTKKVQDTCIQDQTIQITELNNQLDAAVMVSMEEKKEAEDLVKNLNLGHSKQKEQWVTQQKDFETTIKSMQEESTNTKKIQDTCIQDQTIQITELNNQLDAAAKVSEDTITNLRSEISKLSKTNATLVTELDQLNIEMNESKKQNDIDREVLSEKIETFGIETKKIEVMSKAKQEYQKNLEEMSIQHASSQKDTFVEIEKYQDAIQKMKDNMNTVQDENIGTIQNLNEKHQQVVKTLKLKLEEIEKDNQKDHQDLEHQVNVLQMALDNATQTSNSDGDDVSASASAANANASAVNANAIANANVSANEIDSSNKSKQNGNNGASESNDENNGKLVTTSTTTTDNTPHQEFEDKLKTMQDVIDTQQIELNNKNDALVMYREQEQLLKQEEVFKQKEIMTRQQEAATKQKETKQNEPQQHEEIVQQIHQKYETKLRMMQDVIEIKQVELNRRNDAVLATSNNVSFNHGFKVGRTITAMFKQENCSLGIGFVDSKTVKGLTVVRSLQLGSNKDPTCCGIHNNMARIRGEKDQEEIAIGMCLLRINNISTAPMTYSDVITALKQLPRPILLQFGVLCAVSA